MRTPKWTTPGTVSARATIWAFVIYSLVQGSGILLGGSVRWGSPAFTYLRQLPYAPDSWGWALILFGMTLGAASLLRNWWLKAVALTGIVTWSLAFASGAQYAAAVLPTAPTTGGPVYILVAVVAAILVLPDEARKAI
jgi:hypothetical protein